ncbi:hypothetical protein K493DRAFT_316302 [Basidiobolus meristosporus CBS 931.73]|uniref:Protein phosphatase 1 regulatory subunit 21 N-terminal domain-containing protein n=1 Tax=Basidiobolus meristosporus CBS 931.73 TaxID=1314790 RepID=A0A1Y1Y5P1_9FUNG|nr:hypothetical protein K493DRAFT_316302 [Basidiobolus meristosporus CBS 931.73]|eukprot:ORX92924.1 hypothetical protein K493DRAFT_316302 [Basidiobolus meristosporus CBS 931.73]
MTEGALSVNESVVSGGEELSERYQKLFREYSRIKAQHSVLKKAILKEQTQNSELSTENKSKEQELRKVLQQLDTLNFHNQRLTKRVEDLQRNGSPKLGGQWLLRASAKKELEKQRITLEATTLDLQGKIEENENLHKEVYEIHSLYTEQLNVYQKKVDELENEKNLLNEELVKCQMVNENSAQALRSQKKDAELEIKKIREDLNKTKESLAGLRENIAEKSKLQAEEVAVVKRLSTSLHHYDQLYERLFAHDPKSGCRAIFNQCSDLWSDLIKNAQLVEVPRDLQYLLNFETSSFEEYLINEHLPVGHGKGTDENIVVAVQAVLSIYDRLLQVACENLPDATHLHNRNGKLEKVPLSESFSEFVAEFFTQAAVPLDDKARESLLDKLAAVRIGIKSYIQVSTADSTHHVLLSSLNECSDQLSGAIQSVLLTNPDRVGSEETIPDSSQNVWKGIEDAFQESLSYQQTLVSRLAVLQRESSNLIRSNADLRSRHEELQRESAAQKDRASQLESEVNSLKAMIAERESPEVLDQVEDPEAQVERVTAEASTQTTEVFEVVQSQAPVANGVVSSGDEASVVSPSGQSEPEEDLTDNKAINGSSLSSPNQLDPDQMTREDLIKRHYEGKLAQLLERSQEADSQAQRMRKVCQNLVQKLEASEVEKKTIQKQLDEAKQHVTRIQDELRTTEENYKAQLDMMTEHIAQLTASIPQ